MKNLILLFLILINVPLYLTAMKWVQKSGYLEIQDSTRNISWLKFSSDGKYIYSVTYDGVIQKIDLATGDTIKTWPARKLKFDLNPDDESVIEIYQDLAYYTKKMFLNSDSILFDLEIPLNYRPQFGECSCYEMRLKISRENNYIFVSAKCYSDNYNIYNESGFMDLRDINNFDGVYGIEKWMQPVSWAFGKGKQFAYSSVETINDDYVSYKNNICLDSNKYFPLQDTIKHDSIKTIDYLDFSRTSNFLVGTANGKFYIWNGHDGTMYSRIEHKILTGIEADFYDLKWSGQDKYLLCSFTTLITDSIQHKKSYIYIYRADLPFPVDSIVFDADGQNYKLYSAIDSTSLFTVSSNGTIRWFKPALLSSSLNASFTSNITICQPSKPINFYDLSTGNPDSFLWEFGDGSTSIAKEPSHEYQASGLYSVSLTIKKGDSTKTITKENYIRVEEPSSVGDRQNLLVDIKALPNPANSIVKFNITLHEQLPYRLDIYDSYGNKVKSIIDNETGIKNEFSVDMSNLSSGLYFYRFAAGNIIMSDKLILIK